MCNIKEYGGLKFGTVYSSMSRVVQVLYNTWVLYVYVET